MKFIITLTFVLTTLTISTINAQLVSCPLTIPVEKDSTTEVWGLQTSGQTPFFLVGNFKPLPNAKEGFIYSEWVPLNSQLTTSQELNTVFLATQTRVNQLVGTVETSAYYCVYNQRSKKKK